MDDERYRRGLAKLKEVDGEAGERVVAAMQDIAPDFARLMVEYPFGDVYSRPGLDLRSREIATIAALAAMGTCAPQLAVHVNAALNVGVTREEIVEIMIHLSIYAGFPATVNGLAIAKQVFAERDRDAPL
ncbi:carboxymuconolactone decarboxylase family protein [Azospirillum sp.]|uniref:carboxymuconolactone decarboxylase family protein n=1 Tax=Azospirillum sp. TaxID=34012 RepID=UPI002D3E2816|nr:carboxymuconolactone decarboxylase family protein [Azospirillum sp.]HYD69540.1 carboxymuconolactone decarboxylase family protein [Azospirillum sp.]